MVDTKTVEAMDVVIDKGCSFPEIAVAALIAAAPTRSLDITREQMKAIEGKTVRVTLTKGEKWSATDAVYNLSLVEA